MSNMLTELKKFTQKFHKQEDGLTLIEVAIGLVIISLIAIPILQLKKIELRQAMYSDTTGALLDVQDGINQYFTSGNGAYPCPASVSLAEGSVEFGQSSDCTLASVPLCTDPTWKANEGICKTSNNTTDAVIIGAVPFASLKMNEQDTLDYWSNKIMYAVSHEQTSDATYDTAISTITTMAVDDSRDIADGSADGTPEATTITYDLFLYSTGASGFGGFTRQGVEIAPCPAAADSFDSENCDYDDVFFHDVHPTNNYQNAFNDNNASTDFFDDYTLGQSSIPDDTWYQHPENATYETNTNKSYVLSLATNIGISSTRDITSPSADVEVDGIFRVEEDATATVNSTGMLKSDSLCDNLIDQNCFDPQIIAGYDANMQCDTSDTYYGNQGVMQISESAVQCNSSSAFTGNFMELKIDMSIIAQDDCALGARAIGFTSTGELVCEE